jgi:AcrR family transcriptional regulator
MARQTGSSDSSAHDRWAKQIAALDGTPVQARRREPLSTARIVDTALDLVASEGFDAVTMRRVASALDATPGALYAHVRDKAELDDLMFGAVCGRVQIPVPDASTWRQQVVSVLHQLRDQYLQHPGISRVTFTAAPRNLETVRLTEGLLAIVMAGGNSSERAAWFIDGTYLYVAAYSAMSIRRHVEEPAESLLHRIELVEQFRMLPAERFPLTVAHAEDLVSGEGHARFDYMIGLLLDGLAPPGRPAV